AILKERISQLEETIRQNCAGLLPFALVPELCIRLKNQILCEEQTEQVKAGQALLVTAKAEMLERLKGDGLLANIQDISDKTKHQIYHRIDKVLHEPLRVEQVRPSESVHQLSDATSRVLLAWIAQATS